MLNPSSSLLSRYSRLFRFSLAMATALGVPCGLSSAAVIVFKQGASVVAPQSSINIPNYQGTDDTTLLNNGFPNEFDSNYGARGNVLVGAIQSGTAARHGLIRFDVAALQNKYYSIDAITLRFYTQGPTAASNTVNLFRVKPGTGTSGNGEWVEGINNGGGPNGVSTWREKKKGQINWAGSLGMSTVGTDYVGGAANAPLATAAYGPATGTNAAFNLNVTGINLTTLINQWISAEVNNTFGNSRNEGFFLRPQLVVPNTQLALWSTEGAVGVNAFAPELIITYTPLPEPATAIVALFAIVGAVVFKSRLAGLLRSLS
jgi:hypothetical protein